ncbi:MAG: hypothetical protein HYS87_01220 [Candidatus Colwellbacteria bacterium]|nr:hypothetical protein [Candidatus Colwellbacteria bacterium]
MLALDKKVVTAVLFVAVVLAASSIALGQDAPSTAFEDISGFMGLLTRIFNFLFGLFLVAASFLFLYAGVVYLLARGNTEELDKAKSILVWSVVAVAVAVVAWGIPKAIQGFLATGQ